MSKVYIAQRDTCNAPTNQTLMDRKVTKKTEVVVVDNKPTTTKLPPGWSRPDHVIVHTEHTPLSEIRDTVDIATTPYVDTVKIIDSNNNQAYPTTVIAKALGITDPNNVARMEDNLKNKTYRGTDTKVFNKGVDYEVLSVDESMLVRRSDALIVGGLSHSPEVASDLDTVKSHSSEVRSDLDTPKDHSPEVASEKPMVITPPTGNNSQVSTASMTVWSSNATMRIGLMSNTVQGEALYNKVQETLLLNGVGNTDVVEDIIETSNQYVLSKELPKIDTPKGMLTVSEAIKDIDKPICHQQTCAIGRAASKLSKLTNSSVTKVTSAQYRNTRVNAYADNILVDAIEIVLGK